MPGSRRLPRSARVSGAAGLLLGTAAGVAAAVAAEAALAVAAVGAMLGGVVAARLLYVEVTATRREAAAGRADQSRAFGQAMTVTRKEHARFVRLVTERLADRDAAIAQLAETTLAAEYRAARAESALEQQTRRAEAAEDRMASMAEDVRSQEAAALSGVGVRPVGDLAPVADLAAWQARSAPAAAAAPSRREA